MEWGHVGFFALGMFFGVFAGFFAAGLCIAASGGTDDLPRRAGVVAAGRCRGAAAGYPGNRAVAGVGEANHEAGGLESGRAPDWLPSSGATVSLSPG